MIYRKRHQEPRWHCCQNCSQWPAADYREQTVQPPEEAVCEECTRRVKDLGCEVVPEQGVS